MASTPGSGNKMASQAPDIRAKDSATLRKPVKEPELTFSYLLKYLELATASDKNDLIICGPNGVTGRKVPMSGLFKVLANLTNEPYEELVIVRKSIYYLGIGAHTLITHQTKLDGTLGQIEDMALNMLQHDRASPTVSEVEQTKLVPTAVSQTAAKLSDATNASVAEMAPGRVGDRLGESASNIFRVGAADKLEILGEGAGSISGEDPARASRRVMHTGARLTNLNDKMPDELEIRMAASTSENTHSRHAQSDQQEETMRDTQPSRLGRPGGSDEGDVDFGFYEGDGTTIRKPSGKPEQVAKNSASNLQRHHGQRLLVDPSSSNRSSARSAPYNISHRPRGGASRSRRPRNSRASFEPWNAGEASGSSGIQGSYTFDSHAKSRASRVSRRQSRAFAPGLAIKNEAVDPYDPKRLLKPEDKYTLLKEKDNAKPSGTWTTMDPDDNSRGFDPRWHGHGSRGENSRTRIRSEPTEMDITSSTSQLSLNEQSTLLDNDDVPRTATLDERFENPDIDVDPEIREKFRSIGSVLDERTAPRSAFEQRNREAGVRHHTAKVIKVLIGDEVVKKIEQKGDTRGQHQDRFGNYVGENLGQMKKHLVEDRKSLIETRDQEMVRATQEKRAWDAMDPEQREQQRAKRRAPADSFRLGAGAAGAAGVDVLMQTGIPEIYTKKVTASKTPASDGATQRNSLGFNVELGPVADIVPESRLELDESMTRRYANTRKACTTQGRVVAVRLHALVAFSPSAIVNRIFDGVIQEFQFYPNERMALVIFLFTDDAATFVCHAKAIQKNDPQAHRQMQIDVDWYRGDEKEAILPIQPSIYAQVIGKNFERVLRVDRIALDRKREDMADELKERLGKVLINVSIERDPRRHVRELRGNHVKIEFTSIKDAYESLQRFKADKVAGYEGRTVGWTRDPCDRKPEKMPYCKCFHCTRQQSILG